LMYNILPPSLTVIDVHEPVGRSAGTSMRSPLLSPTISMHQLEYGGGAPTTSGLRSCRRPVPCMSGLLLLMERNSAKVISRRVTPFCTVSSLSGLAEGWLRARDAKAVQMDAICAVDTAHR